MVARQPAYEGEREAARRGDPAGQAHLAVVVVAEGQRGQRPRRAGHDGAGVEPPAEQDAEAVAVADQALGRVHERAGQPIAVGTRGMPRVGLGTPEPVPPRGGGRRRELEGRPGRQRPDIGEEGALVQDGLEGEELLHRHRVEAGANEREAQEKSGLAGEHEHVRPRVVVERPRVEAVRRDGDAAGARVVQHEGEASVEAGERGLRVARVPGEPGVHGAGAGAIGKARPPIEEHGDAAGIGANREGRGVLVVDAHHDEAVALPDVSAGDACEVQASRGVANAGSLGFGERTRREQTDQSSQLREAVNAV